VKVAGRTPDSRCRFNDLSSRLGPEFPKKIFCFSIGSTRVFKRYVEHAVRCGRLTLNFRGRTNRVAMNTVIRKSLDIRHAIGCESLSCPYALGQFMGRVVAVEI
jgi:hypothetical protein